VVQFGDAGAARLVQRLLDYLMGRARDHAQRTSCGRWLESDFRFAVRGRGCLLRGRAVLVRHTPTDNRGVVYSRTSSLGETRSFSYGFGDRVETMTYDTGTTQYDYDLADRFVAMRRPQGASVRYERDALDRVTAVRVRGSATAPQSITSYEYDAQGNLARILDPASGITRLHVRSGRPLTERRLPAASARRTATTPRDRVLSVVHRGPMNDVRSSVSYVRSATGEPTRITREDGSCVPACGTTAPGSCLGS
jgi:YD repeat-containing protein